MDKAKAVTAAAHNLARLIYLMITQGQEYVDQGQLYNEERYRERLVRSIAKKATELGMQLVPCRPEHPYANQSLRVCFLKGRTRTVRKLQRSCEHGIGQRSVDY